MIVTPFAPMLAVRSEPFDSADYLFEVKWNGVRALAGSDSDGWRLWGREQADYQPRYPELAFLQRLPPGTVLDGEIVLLRQGVADLDALLRRHQGNNPGQVRHRGYTEPVTYVVFDALYHRGRCLFGEPLYRRRRVLTDLVLQLDEPQIVFSEGLVLAGSIFFEQAVAQGHEGVMAKHLASRYTPGRRSSAWRKIKPGRSLVCVIVGFLPGREGFRRLLVATSHDGVLSYVACLHSGFRKEVRTRLNALLSKRQRRQPVVPCPHPQAVGVEPDLYCQVRFLEWTRQGHLRGASFQRLLGSDGVSTAAGQVPSSE